MGYAELSRDMGVDKKAQKERLPLAASGLMMSLVGYLGSTFSSILNYNNPLLMNYMIGAGVVITVYGLASEMKKKEETLLINAGLNIGNMYPKIVRKQKIDEDITNYIISMPKGLCMADFSARKQIIEQGLNASVEFSFNKNLVMKTNKAELKKEYDFKPVTLDGLKIALGYNKFALQVLDLENAPHVIIAGTTGSGKSICLLNIIVQLVTTNNIDLYLYDAQRVGLGIFENLKMCKGFYFEPQDMLSLLVRLGVESNRRIDAFIECGVDNLNDYNKKRPQAKFKRTVIIVDEFVLLSKNKAISDELRKRVAVDRKVGIHYILCCQRPSKEVIDSEIKANIPCRICFKTSSDQDSEIVFDQKGAEKLRGKGHGLMKSNKVEVDEFQGFKLSTDLAKKLIKPFTEIKQKIKESEPDTSGKI